MIRSTFALATAATLLLATPAQAATNIQFTGIVTSTSGRTAPAAGSTITGNFTIDISDYNWGYATTPTYTSGAALDVGAGGAVRVTGNAWFSDGTTIRLDDSLFNYASQYVERSAGYNEVDYAGQTSPGPLWSALEVWAWDYSENGDLFIDPDGGVALDQGVDLSGAFLGGYFAGVGSGVQFQGDFTPTSITVTSVPEPANLALLLAGVGLVGLRARRRPSEA